MKIRNDKILYCYKTDSQDGKIYQIYCNDTDFYNDIIENALENNWTQCDSNSNSNKIVDKEDQLINMRMELKLVEENLIKFDNYLELAIELGSEILTSSVLYEFREKFNGQYQKDVII